MTESLPRERWLARGADACETPFRKILANKSARTRDVSVALIADVRLGVGD